MPENKNTPGRIAWVDLTVPDAGKLRDFYAHVVGWQNENVEMGGYCDFVMLPPGSREGVAGICHARGENAALPPQWLVYLVVTDLDESMKRCREKGGEVIVPPASMGSAGRFCVIRDPAGAVAALFCPATDRQG